jgi:shikimate dehydrogenase
MIKLGLIGKDIAHSQSQKIYEDLLGQSIKYELFDIKAIDDLPELKSLLQGFTGLSVTAPYKKELFKKVDEIQGDCPLSLVNALKLKEDRIFGINTDYFALQTILKKYKAINPSHWYILGDGNMSQIVQFILKDEELTVHSRRNNNLTKLPDFIKNSIIINTCGRSYLFQKMIDPSVLFFDLNYGLAHEKFFKTNKLRYENGLEMLKLQAQHALNFWNLNK